MGEERFEYEDFEVPANWSSERKWQRLQELLLEAVSVEVLRDGTRYVFRVWYEKG
jgi:hypothetical protein